MADKNKIQEIVDFLLQHGDGYDDDEAREIAEGAIEEGQPVIETICLHRLAEHILAGIHDPSWIVSRANEPDCEDSELLKRLLDSGASSADLALFARMSQREYLSNLCGILDGAGIYGTPSLPHEEFRIFAVNDSGEPIATIDDLHESLGFSDLETEMELSRKAEQDSEDAG
jgi:hypothetical protein